MGGSTDAIGIKITLESVIQSGRKFRIGFMSDTDGLAAYMESYKQSYLDCDIIIPHLGAIQKEPNGYKHSLS